MELSPTWMQKQLYRSYSSSQSYYKESINKVVCESRCFANIIFEDIEYLVNVEEYLRRHYGAHEFHGKMLAFKDYYYYHEDCPRIFTKCVEQPYSRWQDRKRDFVYKKLKLIYKEPCSSEDDDSGSFTKGSIKGMTHFLNDISQYNPFSKKYYLRHKEKARPKASHENTQSLLKNLGDDLSLMLGSLQDISTLSNPFDAKEAIQMKAFKRSKLKEGQESTQLPSNSSNAPFPSSKNSFKKKKDSLVSSPLHLQKSTQLRVHVTSGPSLLQLSNTPLSIHLLSSVPKGSRQPSPKVTQNTQKLSQPSLFRSKSISSVGQSRGPEFRMQNALSLKHQQRTPSKETILDNKTVKTTFATRSTSKSKLALLPLTEQVRIRDMSNGKKTKGDEFSDRKINQNLENKLRTRQSEYSSSKKMPILRPKLPEGPRRYLQIKPN